MTGSRWAAVIGVVAYTSFLAATPFLHHDLTCELKNPLHCTACASTVLGADPNPPSTPGASHLADAGRAVLETVLFEDLLLAVRTTGRSPPAA
jgi:hypothetical protein